MDIENVPLEENSAPQVTPEEIIHFDPPARRKIWIYFGLSIALVLMVAFYLQFVSAPNNFPLKKIVRITKGMSIEEAGGLLKQDGVIRNVKIFAVLVRFSPGGGEVMAGDYIFTEKINLIRVASRLAKGDFELGMYRIVIPEGSPNKEIAEILKSSLPYFNEGDFLAKASPLEGQLFPDTYFFPSTATEDEIINRLHDNFLSKVRSIMPDVEKSGRTLNEIITMASLIEEEANTKESRRIISGILWQRIKQGMRLQVDAVFPYIMNKFSLQLTKEDLMDDSPYNTYRYAGLPPGPISNPGWDSIYAAIYPAKTSYLYYLSDREGNMYYAKTFEEHKANKAKYLGN